MLKAMMKKLLKQYAPFLVKADVPQLLNKGRSWTAQLREAARVTEAEAVEVGKQITELTKEQDTLNEEAVEGREVAANFHKMLHASKNLN